MIRIEKLNYTATNKVILEDINLEIKENEITVFLGENGSGKTTLFNSMVDLYKNKYSGNIYIDDKLIKDLSSKEISKNITYNFQVKSNSNIYVYELLELARLPYKNLSMKLSKEENELIEYAVTITGIKDLLDKKMDILSGGERQMVFLAMSIIQDTKYMLFDEPNTYLDITNKKKLFDILKMLKNKGHSIILSLHSIETALSIADKIYVLKNGKIVGHILKEDFDNETLIEETFNVKKYIINENEKIYIVR